MTFFPSVFLPYSLVISFGTVSSTLITTGDGFCDKELVIVYCSLGYSGWVSAGDDRKKKRVFTRI